MQKEQAGLPKKPIDNVKHRLDQLDDSEEQLQKKSLRISQTEYIKRIEKLHSDLQGAWANNQRVKSLKIAIQVPAALTLSMMSCALSFMSLLKPVLTWIVVRQAAF